MWEKLESCFFLKIYVNTSKKTTQRRALWVIAVELTNTVTPSKCQQHVVWTWDLSELIVYFRLELTYIQHTYTVSVNERLPSNPWAHSPTSSPQKHNSSFRGMTGQWGTYTFLNLYIYTKQKKQAHRRQMSEFYRKHCKILHNNSLGLKKQEYS